eukprot:scaffold4472_cov180-Amphora_coffeaeformis.AAC.11
MVMMRVSLSILCILSPCLAFSPHGQRTLVGNGKASKPDKQYSDSSRSYANLVDPPPMSTKPSFERRMRDLVMTPKKEENASSNTTPENPNVHRVVSLKDYKHTVAETDKITVVRFYADYCRACKAMSPSFYRLAQTINDNTQWVEVPILPQTAAIHKGLHVPSTPYGHIYHPEAGLVEELRMRKEYLSDFARILESYRNGKCPLPDEPNPETGIYETIYDRHA